MNVQWKQSKLANFFFFVKCLIWILIGSPNSWDVHIDVIIIVDLSLGVFFFPFLFVGSLSQFSLCCNFTATCKSAGATYRAASNGHLQPAAVITTGRGCSLSRDGGITAILGRNIGWITWSIWILRKCCKLYGSNGNGDGQTWNSREFSSSGELLMLRFSVSYLSIIAQRLLHTLD